MPYTPERQYHSVDLPEYLDNGQPDITPRRRFDQKQHERLRRHWDTFIQEPWQPLNRPNSVISVSSSTRAVFLGEISRLCEEQLGVGAIQLEFPGGPYRSSFRAHLENSTSVIITRRTFHGRATMEAMILDRLYSHKANVPAPFGFNGLVLIQEDLLGERLADMEVLQTAEGYIRLISAALAGLNRLHTMAQDIGLDQMVYPMGQHTDWLVALLDRSMVVGTYLGVPSPTVPVAALFDLLTLIRPRFIKWDARPGNAIVRDDETIGWFDWEHCCARHHLDDMVWLLCDESLPDHLASEETQLIESYLNLFADGRSEGEAHEYLRSMGVFHCCTRLGRLLHAKARGSWTDADQQLEKPLGTSLTAAVRLARRGARWAEHSDYARPLAAWFRQVAEQLPKL